MDIPIVRRGKIIASSKAVKTFDGDSAAGFDIEIGDDTRGSTGGFYIFYSKLDKRYDDWYESEDVLNSILGIMQNDGMVIEWTKEDR